MQPEPEPLPWDRFRERRHDGSGPGPRWREQPPHNGFRGRVPGNGRPGPWRYHSSESGRGFTPSRANDKFIGDEGVRPSGYRMEGRYYRFNRDNNKGPFGHRDNMRGQHSWENDMFPNSSGRPYFGNDQRSDDLRGHCWANGRLQNGSDQRSLDEKSSFGRRDMRGKFWESSNGNVQYSGDDKASFEKKDLKRRFSPENGAFPNSFGRSHVLNDHRPVDDKGSFGQKNLRGKSCENGPNQSSLDDKDIKEHSVEINVVPNSTDRLQIGTDQIPHDGRLTCTSPTHSEHFRDQCEKSSGANDVVPGQKLENENSLVSIDWKPLKWSRTGSLSSRGSLKSPDSAEQKTEIPPHNATPLRSPFSGDACATGSAVSSDETGSRKKPRLGWGEGLAKFEKKKVEGPDDDSATKPGLFVCVSGEPSQVSDKSPRVAGLLECASPATPSSISCSFSPIVEDKACARSANLDYDTNYSSGPPNLLLQEHTERNQDTEFCLENVEHISVSNLSSSLTELFQLEDPAMVESNFMRTTALNKLLVWRGEALKALEVTESEIDSLENDLKKLISCQAKPFEDVEKIGEVLIDALGENFRNDLEISTSEFVEPPREVKGNMNVDVVENLKNCPFIVSNDGKVEGLSSSEGSDHSIAALTSERAEALCDQILASNKDTASRAYEVFSKLLPSNHALGTSNVSSWKENPWIMEKFVFKKRCRRFQERVNILKYRALQYLWKEDLQLMSLKKNNPKSHKRLELNSRGSQGSKKHRSFRSRLSNAAGNLSLVPTAGAINFTSKLLSDSQVKPCRYSLKMPDLIMDKERITSRFISNNGLVEDPCAVEKERKMINHWTKEEKDIFMDKFATFRKDFNKISSFLDHKTTADCVEFYYKNHKSDCFVKLKKKPDLAKQGKSYSFNNYLVGSGKRLDRETNAASLDALGEASEIAANAHNAMKNHRESKDTKASKIDDFDAYVNERETEAADVLAGICGSISSEAMGSCITSSFDRGENYENALLSNQKMGSDDDSCSDDSCGEIEPNNWTDEEKSVFIEAVASYGNDFVMISRRVGTKSRDQCKVFFSKARKCLGLDTIRARPCGEGEDDNNGGGSDLEGAVCVADSAVSSEKSSSKVDKEGMLSDVDMNNLGKNDSKEIVESVSSEKSPTKVDKDVIISDVDMNDLGHNDCKKPNKTEKMIFDDIVEESKPEVDLECDVKTDNGVKNGDVSTLLHPVIGEGRGIEEALSPVGSVSADVAQAEEQEIASENNSNDGENEKNLNEKHDATINCSRDLNCVQDVSQAEEQEMVSENNSNDGENEKNLKVMQEETGNCVQDLNHAQDLNLVQDLECDTASKVVIKQENQIPIDLNPPLEQLDISLGGDSCYVNRTSMSVGTPSSSLDDFGNITKKLNKKSTSIEACTQQQVFAGYPLQVAVKREMNGSDKPGTPSLGLEFPFHSHESKKSHLRHHSWSNSSDTEKPKNNGDVKLFGQILKSQPKEITSENINQKLNGANIVVGSELGKFDRNNSPGLENVPSRGFGFWDGTIGFPTVPDSAILLAKYPAAFGNFSSTSNVEYVKSSNNDLNLNGVSVFPSNGNGVVDYQSYRNQQDLISEMQRRNDFDNSNSAFSSLQNLNVGISDPVAAIKMHYAKVEKYANNVVVEEESWRGKA